MELILPEEFYPESQRLTKKYSLQSGFDQEEFSSRLQNGNSKRDGSCRKRVLSVIKEEAEGSEE